MTLASAPKVVEDAAARGDGDALRAKLLAVAADEGAALPSHLASPWFV